MGDHPTVSYQAYFFPVHHNILRPYTIRTRVDGDPYSVIACALFPFRAMTDLEKQTRYRRLARLRDLPAVFQYFQAGIHLMPHLLSDIKFSV